MIAINNSNTSERSKKLGNCFVFTVQVCVGSTGELPLVYTQVSAVPHTQGSTGPFRNHLNDRVENLLVHMVTN